MQSRALAEIGSSQDPQTLPVGIYPAAFAQRRLWFLDQLQGPTSAYNVHIGLWLYGPLDFRALQAGLQIVVDRHESLRTCFALTRNGLIQLVLPSSPVALPFTDYCPPLAPTPQEEADLVGARPGMRIPPPAKYVTAEESDACHAPHATT